MSGRPITDPPAARRRPRLQVGLPVYNGAEYLAEALDSLLAQTYDDVEILISDNGSTDATPAIAAHYAAGAGGRVRSFRYDTNRGAAWNFNNVFHLADAELFKWAAHDDRHEATFLERCVAVLDEHSDVAMCCTASRSIDAHGTTIGDIRREHCHLLEDSPAARFARTLGLYPMHVLFGVARRRALGRTRLWGTTAGADRVLVSEIALAGKIYEIDDPLFVRRWHPGVSWRPGIPDREYAAWFDPRNRTRSFAAPKVERAASYGQGIHHAGLDRHEASKAYGHWLRYGLWTRGVCSVVEHLHGHAPVVDADGPSTWTAAT